MQPFAPCDRVVAINTDMSAPIRPSGDFRAHPFLFPDGPLQRGVIYHVESVLNRPDGSQGVYLTGMRVTWGDLHISWDSSRFRKVEEAGHPTVAEKEEEKTKVKIRRITSKPIVVCSS